MSQNEDLFFGGLILGAMAGAAFAVLFTPITGAEAQQRLKKKLEDLKNGSGRGTATPLQAAEKANIASMLDEIVKGDEGTDADEVSDTVDSIEEDIIKLSKAVEKVKKSHSKKRHDAGGASTRED